ncbi:MAG: hypothetical protein H6672_15825 [Anaerolineaceae bacterium]|nr:hypothetical protein [Anaerolineaceae bacterium]
MTLRNKRFIIPFDHGQAAYAVHVSRRFDPHWVATTLGFHEPRPAIYVTGGAKDMSDEDMYATRRIVERGLARFAEELGAVVIDGGTNVGVPALVGDARRKNRYRFPLVGVVPLEMVRYPGYENESGGPLNEGHSHFVLTTGDEFGAESDMITRLTSQLSGGGQKPAFGVLINGGQITREEVYSRTTSDDLSFPLFVIEGTGRFADILARAFHAGESDDKQLKAILKKGRLSVTSINDGPDLFYHQLLNYVRNYTPPVSTNQRPETA